MIWRALIFIDVSANCYTSKCFMLVCVIQVKPSALTVLLFVYSPKSRLEISVIFPLISLIFRNSMISVNISKHLLGTYLLIFTDILLIFTTDITLGEYH